MAGGVDLLMGRGGAERSGRVEAGAIGQLDPIDGGQIAGPIPLKLTGTGQAPSTASAASWRSGSGLGSTPSAALRASIRPERAGPSRSVALNAATGR
ncbi:hypothetical protein WH5701_10984 [Synechococcus sp. WH 5701]|nr:hypothetical protein WH5701_10984 [Synechococcus sp. WH 5701]